MSGISRRGVVTATGAAVAAAVPAGFANNEANAQQPAAQPTTYLFFNADEVALAMATAAKDLAGSGCSVTLIDLTEKASLEVNGMASIGGSTVGSWLFSCYCLSSSWLGRYSGRRMQARWRIDSPAARVRCTGAESPPSQTFFASQSKICYSISDMRAPSSIGRATAF